MAGGLHCMKYLGHPVSGLLIILIHYVLMSGVVCTSVTKLI